MKRFLFILPIISCFILLACNESEKKSGETEDPKVALADSLEKEVIDEHDIVMPKSMKIPAIQKEIQRLIDSIGKLPAKAQSAAAPYKTKLEGLKKDLSEAHTSMDKWMEEFGQRMQALASDSTKEAVEQKIKVYTEEKLKVSKVKEAVLESLQKADSLLKSIPSVRRD